MKPDKILPNGTIIHVTTMIGDGRRYLTAWERTDLARTPGNWHSFYGHGTIAHFEGLDGTYGRIGTDNLPPEIEKMRGATRMAHVDSWHERCRDRAYAAILAAFPEAASGARSAGEIALAPAPEAVR